MKRFCTNDCQSDKFDVYPEESLKLPSEKYLKRKLSYSTFRNHSGNNPGPKRSFYYFLHKYYITYVVRDVLGLLTQFYLTQYLDSLQCRLLDVVLRNQVHMHIFFFKNYQRGRELEESASIRTTCRRKFKIVYQMQKCFLLGTDN